MPARKKAKSRCAVAMGRRGGKASAALRARKAKANKAAKSKATARRKRSTKGQLTLFGL
jgi:hypothetical protein